MTYFLALYEYAYASGDVRDLKRLSHPECVFCGSVIDGATDDHAAGRSSTGGTLRVLESRGTKVSEDFFRVEVQMVQEPGTETDERGETTEFPRKSFQLEAAVRTHRDRVVVREVSVTPVQVMTQPEGSPATSKPRSPTPLTEEGRDGGVAAAAQYALLHAYARATGDAAPMTALAADECDTCDAIAEAAGSKGTNAPLEPDTVVAVTRTYPTGASMTQQFTSLRVTARTEWVDNSTFELGDGLPEATHWLWRIAAVYEDGRWRIQSADVSEVSGGAPTGTAAAR